VPNGDDSGFSLVEAVVSIAVLTIVLVPTIRLVIFGQQTTNASRIQGEAAAVATQSLENLEAELQQGILPIQNSKTTVMAGPDRLTVIVKFSITSSGTSTTICSTASGGAAPGTWIATATVYWGPEVSHTWPLMDGVQPVQETTELAPGLAGALAKSAGEIAVPILNADGTPYTSSPVEVDLSVTPSSTTAPSGQIVSGTQVTQTGCAVFLNVDPASGLTYTVSINNSANSIFGTGGAEIINASEQSYDNYQSPITSDSGLAVQVGEPTLAPPFYVGQAASVTDMFQTYSSTTPYNVLVPSVPPAGTIPVTVEDPPFITAPGHVFPQLSAGIMYLYPFSSAYSAWAGDMAYSNPGANNCGPSPSTGYCYTTTPTPTATTINAVSSAAPTAYLHVYDLALTLSTTLPTGDQLTATDAEAGSPGTVYDLNAPSGTADATGLPLGEYVLGDTQGKATAKYVWVTNDGVYYASSGMNAPSVGTLATSGVPVTV
jgi:hypothetical protein